MFNVLVRPCLARIRQFAVFSVLLLLLAGFRPASAQQCLHSCLVVDLRPRNHCFHQKISGRCSGGTCWHNDVDGVPTACQVSPGHHCDSFDDYGVCECSSFACACIGQIEIDGKMLTVDQVCEPKTTMDAAQTRTETAGASNATATADRLTAGSTITAFAAVLAIAAQDP